MDWISGIGRDSRNRLHVEAQWLDSPSTWTDIERLTADLGIDGTVRRKVELPLHQFHVGNFAEYLSGLALAGLNATCQSVYEFETTAGTVVLPSQLLVLATIGANRPFRRALLRPWGPSFLMNATDEDGQYEVAPTPHRRHDLKMARDPSITRMRWLQAYPSASAAWGSVYASALKGRFDMRMPNAIVSASIRGKLVGGKLLATRLQLLELWPTEEPFEFAEHAPRHFVFNEAVHRRPAHGKAAAPSSDSALTVVGTVQPLTDAEWARVEPLLQAILASPDSKHPGRSRSHALRDVIETIRLKLGTPYAWSKCPGDRPLVQSASVLLSKLQRAGMWDKVVAAGAGGAAAPRPPTVIRNYPPSV
ncbi:transposase [Paucibacter sp. JuS9]|uniref:transposase n=1 Tax=Paucibacter sp. JuS9 TaxID=3228748 RepID=UPI0037581D93